MCDWFDAKTLSRSIHLRCIRTWSCIIKGGKLGIYEGLIFSEIALVGVWRIFSKTMTEPMLLRVNSNVNSTTDRLIKYRTKIFTIHHNLEVSI